MNVLLLGSGGREHALAWKMKQSRELNRLFIAPGNAGTAALGTNIPLKVTDFEGIKKFSLDNDIDMLVVGLFDLSDRLTMQLVWIGTSLVLAFALLKIDTGFYETYAFVFYLAGIFLLIVTCLVAPEINGSRSWLVLGPVRLQPAEFMKFIIALALAKVFSLYDFRLMKRKNLLFTFSIILLPAILVVLQSETGTALVYASFLLVLFREGLPGGILFVLVAAIVYFVLGIKFSDTQMGLFPIHELK
jgi:rod shape determining protein RodA